MGGTERVWGGQGEFWGALPPAAAGHGPADSALKACGGASCPTEVPGLSRGSPRLGGLRAGRIPHRGAKQEPRSSRSDLGLAVRGGSSRAGGAGPPLRWAGVLLRGLGLQDVGFDAAPSPTGSPREPVEKASHDLPLLQRPRTGGGGWPCAGGGLAQAQSCKPARPRTAGAGPWGYAGCRAPPQPPHPAPLCTGVPAPEPGGCPGHHGGSERPVPSGDPGGVFGDSPGQGHPCLEGCCGQGARETRGGRGSGAVSPVSPPRAGCGEGGPGTRRCRAASGRPARPESPRLGARGQGTKLGFPWMPAELAGGVEKGGGTHQDTPCRAPAQETCGNVGLAGLCRQHRLPRAAASAVPGVGSERRPAAGRGGARSPLCSGAVRDVHERGPAPASPRCLAEPAGSDLGAGGRGRRRLQGAASLRDGRSPSPGVTGLLLPQELRSAAESRGRGVLRDWGCARLAETLPGMGQTGRSGPGVTQPLCLLSRRMHRASSSPPVTPALPRT
ncbi:hypothetical protein LUU34_01473500 [Aix galericulata]|nr:hypothetical protein LUU34_01473500 [Aix galericulata]